MPVAETVRSFKEIVDGEHDDIPERAFYMQGPIDQVLEASKKMSAEEPAESAEAEAAEQEAKAEEQRRGSRGLADGRAQRRRPRPHPRGARSSSGEVEQLSTRTAVGEIGILANHVPVLARLRPTELRLHMPGGEVQRWAQAEGWLQVFANRATVLVGEALPPDQLDEGELRSRIEDADARLSESEEGSGAYARPAEKERAEAFLEVPKRQGTSPRAFLAVSRRGIPQAPTHPCMDELALAQRLIAFDTSNAEGLRRAAEFVGGWLESNDIKAAQTESRGLPVTTAEVGPPDAPDAGAARPYGRGPGRPRSVRASRSTATSCSAAAPTT